MELMQIQHLSKVYGQGENQVRAVDDISFTVEKGEFLAIIGPSGSGKSTLLHILGGVDRPTSGKVFVDGQDVYAQNEDQLAIFRRRQVGLIYQFYNLIPGLNVVENMTLPVLMDGRQVNQERLEELLYAMAALPGIRVRGLMTVPPILTAPEEQRRVFSQMYKLFIDIRGKNIDNIRMDMLSMGMSSDYEQAILEGSTLVRIGSALFGRRL